MSRVHGGTFSFCFPQKPSIWSFWGETGSQQQSIKLWTHGAPLRHHKHSFDRLSCRWPVYLSTAVRCFLAACSPEPVWMIGFDYRTGAVRAARARKISRVYKCWSELRCCGTIRLLSYDSFNATLWGHLLKSTSCLVNFQTAHPQVCIAGLLIFSRFLPVKFKIDSFSQ